MRWRKVGKQRKRWKVKEVEGERGGRWGRLKQRKRSH